MSRPSADGRRLGARYLGRGRTAFTVWAPRCKTVDLVVAGPRTRRLPMSPAGQGYFVLTADQAGPGTRYRFRPDGGKERPDPASRFQPQGVHGPSEVVGTDFAWTSRAWRGLPLDRYVIYELHVGTFSARGDFAGLIPGLKRLKDLGVTAVELMPVAQFPGARNWGYDGAYPFAAQDSYGGPRALKRFVDACHGLGMAAVLDVVYNHLGPEGCYLRDFAPYFTRTYETPWGEAVNFDGPGSDEVRRYFIENAVQWVSEFRFDALRLDAIHAIKDSSARPFLAELAGAVGAAGRREGRLVHVIAESDLNDHRVIRPRGAGGLGCDAQWSDDFHHSLHALLTGERKGYYEDFGELRHLAKALREGYVCSGQHSAHRGRRHGNSSAGDPACRFVVCSQNHDQVGNRAQGDRFGTLLDFESRKLAAGTVLLSPFIPLLFMGEEYGETAPFQYFVSHGAPGLRTAVAAGRKKEFSSFGWRTCIPDPNARATFLRSKIRPSLARGVPHAALQRFYKELLRLRRSLPALKRLTKRGMRVEKLHPVPVLAVLRKDGARRAAILLHFGRDEARVPWPFQGRTWRKRLDSSAPAWGGPGTDAPARIGVRGARLRLAPRTVILYTS